MCLPPKEDNVDILIPSTSECNLVWKQGVYMGNQVTMRPLGWALTL